MGREKLSRQRHLSEGGGDRRLRRRRRRRELEKHCRWKRQEHGPVAKPIFPSVREVWGEVQ